MNNKWETMNDNGRPFIDTVQHTYRVRFTVDEADIEEVLDAIRGYGSVDYVERRRNDK